MRRVDNFIVWSNLAFLAPLFFAVSKSLYLYASLIFAVLIFSCLFHLSRGKRFKNIDGLFALLLIGTNLYEFYSKGFSVYFWMATVFVIIGFYFKKRKHSAWHIASAIITLLAII